MNKYYVYQHIRIDTGECFYIGKGNGSRMFSSKGRNEYWKRIVAKAQGFKAILIANNLSEPEAFNFEIAMIEGAKKIGLAVANIAKGGKGSSGFRHTEKFKNEVRLRILLNNPMNDPETRALQLKNLKIAMQNPRIRAKISLAHIGKKLSNSHIENLRTSHLGVCSRGEGSASKKVKFENVIFDCIKDLADFVGINHKTMYTRLSRNPQKWGYEVIGK